MKLKYLLLLLYFNLASAGFAAEIPDRVSAGFKEYAEHGSEAAWNAWTRDSPLKDHASMKADWDKVSAAASKNLGKSLGEEVIQIRDISSSFKILYFTWKFERGPLFVRFNCYRASNTWIVTWIQSSDVVENVVPNEKWFVDQKSD